MAAIAFLLKN